MSRGRGNIRDISRQEPTDEERKALSDALSHKSPPIVIAVLGAAMLEFELEKRLRPKFKRHDDKTWGRLNGENGPLGSFAAKINAAHALGILDDHERHNFVIVKDVRNAFAHSKKLIDFEHTLIRKELQDIELPAQKRSQAYRGLDTAKNECTTGKSAFIVLCFALSTNLSLKETKRLNAQTRRHRRNIKVIYQSPFFGALANGLPYPRLEDTIVGQELRGEKHPNAGPTSPNSLLNYFAKFPPTPKSGSSGGK